MLPIIFVVLLTVECIFGQSSANQYVDNFLRTAFINEIKTLNLDPSALADFETEFEDKVRIIGKVKGTAEFFDGNMTGLAEAERDSDCQGVREFSTESKITNCTLLFQELKVAYHGKMKYGKMPKVGIRGKCKLKKTVVSMEIVQSLPMLPTVRTLSFVQLGKAKIKFSGLGPFNRFTEALEDEFEGHVQAEVVNIMSQRLQYALNRAVAQVPLAFF